MKIKILFFLLLSFNYFQAQNLFPLKIEGCQTDKFELEKDSIKANIGTRKFIDIICSNLNSEDLSRIKGVLKVQIIVYKDGSSCLISFDNKTNIKTSKFNLKKTIDEKVKWETKSDEKISPLIILNFSKKSILFRRIGISGNFESNIIFEEEILKKE